MVLHWDSVLARSIGLPHLCGPVLPLLLGQRLLRPLVSSSLLLLFPCELGANLPRMICQVGSLG